jgi:peptide/nickel transport system ATP-binding protein
MNRGLTESARSNGAPGPQPEAARPLVQVDRISKVFDVSAPWLNRVIERKPRQLLQAVRDVSFHIARGETLALVGESG